MFKLLTFFSFHRSFITMGIIRVLIFASLVAGTLGFFWPKSGQEIRPWDLADQIEEAARLEKLCKENSPYCFSTYSGSGAFGSFRHDPCGRSCPWRPLDKRVCSSCPFPTSYNMDCARKFSKVFQYGWTGTCDTKPNKIHSQPCPKFI